MSSISNSNAIIPIENKLEARKCTTQTQLDSRESRVMAIMAVKQQEVTGKTRKNQTKAQKKHPIKRITSSK